MIRKTEEIKIDTLLMIVASLAAGIGLLAVASSVNTVILLIFIIFWAIGLAAYIQAKAGLPDWLANSLALLAVAVTFFATPENYTLADRLGLIIILMGIKFSRTKTPRDYLQIFLLVTFLLAGAAYLFSDAAFLIPLLALLLLLGAGAVLLSYASEDRSSGMNLMVAGRVALWTMLMVLAIVPAAAAFFIILPRSGYPVLSFRAGQPAGVSGFSDRISLGLVASIQDSSAVAFRAEIGPKRISESALYWRGIVFDNFDGRNWTTTAARTGEDTRDPRPSGAPIPYTVYLEPSNSRVIFTLDQPVNVYLRPVFRRPDLTYSTFAPVGSPLRYNALSIATEVIPRPIIAETVYRQLPPELERIKKLEESLVRDHADPTLAIKALMSFLQSGNFQYTQSSLPLSDKPLEEFLFTGRRGNCEYFASALAVMLRMAGIPARIVGGYRGGYFQEEGGYYIVYQKNAHVWVEAHVTGTGWVRLDPTPARSADFTSAVRRGLRFWSSVKFDILKYYFMIFVMNYDVQMQSRLFSRLASSVTRLPALPFKAGKHLTFWAAILVILGIATFLYGHIHRRGNSLEERLLRAFLVRMEGLGYRKAPFQGLEEFISHIKTKDIYSSAAEFVKRYEESFYRDRPFSPSEAALLDKIIRCIPLRPLFH